MSRLRDPNIVRVLGLCEATEKEPPLVIVEYMKYGDLNQFLQQHVPENIYNTAKAANAPILTYVTVCSFISSVSSAF